MKTEIEWQSVAEGILPYGTGRYLAASCGEVYLAIYDEDRWIDCTCHFGAGGNLTHYILHGITHWAELPVAP